ncbi:serine acetyltransferase [Sphingomonas paeninsulae]|uniref:serine O-acetyltransferase n=1 Tax=Sphingomonas paeninsulae TaxID=2319844 RepID=A0A494TFB0_SPHPE|nr:serine O-acetyltransferase EpsC [Sphingomonas paeninsulae]AYJ85952.1 serine acetyltransferase [Sphingomonas paeninsulae]
MTQNKLTVVEAEAPNHLDISGVIIGLRSARDEWRAAHQRHAELGTHGFPSRRSLDRIVGAIGAALFPLRLGPPELNPDNEDAFVEATLESALSQLGAQVRLNLIYAHRELDALAIEARVNIIVGEFAGALPRLRTVLDSDVQAAYLGDPAARSVDEVLLCYPCLIAVIHHRIAHELYRLGAPLVARIISEIANSRTGIDIHPGAIIGHSFFIDHGTGVVIGETAVIGNNVRLYQAVTLGAKSFPSEADGRLTKGIARHPIVEDNVIIYSGATILGRVTIGQGSVIGGNVWITTDVPQGTTVAVSVADMRSITGDRVGTE